MFVKNKKALISSRHGELSIYRRLVLDMLEEGLNLANPETYIKKALESEKLNRIRNADKLFVVSIGKAGSSLARGFIDVVERRIDYGVIVAPYGYGKDVPGFHVIESGHPLIDENSLRAGEEVVANLDGAGEDDLVILLVSGGGSSALSHPPADIPFEEKQKVIKYLMEKGAGISEINTVRRHISIVKGGWLAFIASPAPLINFIVSDVPGDRPEDVASGPGVPDPTTHADALNILKKYGLVDDCKPVSDYLLAGVMDMVPETPDENHPIFKKVSTEIILKNSIILDGIKEIIEREGHRCEIVQWNTLDELVEKHLELIEKGEKGFYISGGEFPVGAGGGRGGPNQELAVRIGLGAKTNRAFVFAGIDTDGKDGNSGYAGGIIDSISRNIWNKRGVNVEEYLSEHNTAEVLESSDDAIDTGPTGTNVNHLRILFIPSF